MECSFERHRFTSRCNEKHTKSGVCYNHNSASKTNKQRTDCGVLSSHSLAHEYRCECPPLSRCTCEKLAATHSCCVVTPTSPCTTRYCRFCQGPQLCFLYISNAFPSAAACVSYVCINAQLLFSPPPLSYVCLWSVCFAKPISYSSVYCFIYIYCCLFV